MSVDCENRDVPWYCEINVILAMLDAQLQLQSRPWRPGCQHCFVRAICATDWCSSSSWQLSSFSLTYYLPTMMMMSADDISSWYNTITLLLPTPLHHRH
jgi:hypothetical protein